jgi:hypothetical protein
MIRRLFVLIIGALALSAVPAPAAETPPEIGSSPASGPPGTVVLFTNVPACATTGDTGSLHYGIGLSRTEDDTTSATEKYGGPNVEFTIPKVADGDYFIVIYCSTLVRSYPFHVGLVAPTPMQVQPTVTG